MFIEIKEIVFYFLNFFEILEKNQVVLILDPYLIV
jgi:hypothetical protein